MDGFRAVPGVRRACAAALSLLVAGISAGVAHAHGFGQRYDLPLPLPLWVGGAGVSILLSFVVAAVFLRKPGQVPTVVDRDLLDLPFVRQLGSAPVVAALRTVSVGLWLLAIAAGLYGQQDAYTNIAPTLVWIVGWVGLSFASIFFGDVWATLHPLATVFSWIEKAVRRGTGRSLTLGRAWPAALGVWPAVALFAVFAWLELVWSASDVPYELGRVLALYSGVTLFGMFVFGRDRWLACGELFYVAFGVLARFSVFQLRPTSETSPRAWRLRPPGVGLLEGLPLSVSQMVFVTLMLATVTFDGLLETRQWLAVADRLSIAGWMQPVLSTLRDFGFSDDEILGSIGFAAVPLVFLSLLALTARVTRSLVKGRGGALPESVPSSSEIARTLVATLVPIAIAYHLAHYLSMLVVSGQYLIPLISDPFGFGWNLWGTADYRVDIGILGVRFVWYSAAFAIVSGHVVAVVLAHVLALRDCGTRRAALWSQVPSLVLMVGYTMLSLWTLAQPIVE